MPLPYTPALHPTPLPYAPTLHLIPLPYTVCLPYTLCPYPTPYTPALHPIPLPFAIYPYPSPYTPTLHLIPYYTSTSSTHTTLPRTLTIPPRTHTHLPLPLTPPSPPPPPHSHPPLTPPPPPPSHPPHPAPTHGIPPSLPLTPLSPPSPPPPPPGFPDGILGSVLTDNFRKQSLRFGTNIVTETVNRLDLSTRPFKIYTDSVTVEAQTVIIATGAVARRMEFKGSGEENGFWNKVCVGGALGSRVPKPHIVGPWHA